MLRTIEKCVGFERNSGGNEEKGFFSSDSNRTLALCDFDSAVVILLKVSVLGAEGVVKTLCDTSPISASKCPLFIDSITNELKT